MLRSPAMAVLSLSARRVLERLEIEMADHGGTDNGRLPVTFDDFQRFGILIGTLSPPRLGGASARPHRGHRARRRRQCGVPKAEFLRLTFRHTQHAGPTNDWRRIKTLEEASAIARSARTAKTKKPNAGVAETTTFGAGTRHRKGRSASVGNRHAGPMSETDTTYRGISGGGTVH